MMKKSLFFILVFLASLSILFGQEMSVPQLTTKMIELEKRIASLEEILITGNTNITDTENKQIPLDRVSWRKLKIKMNEDNVRLLLGEPVRIQHSGLLYTWNYSKETWHSYVKFDDKGVYSWTEPE